MTGDGRGVRWERLAIVRSPLFLLVGLGFLCVAAFHMPWSWAGWAAIGVSLILISYLIDGPVSDDVRR